MLAAAKGEIFLSAEQCDTILIFEQSVQYHPPWTPHISCASALVHQQTGTEVRSSHIHRLPFPRGKRYQRTATNSERLVHKLMAESFVGEATKIAQAMLEAMILHGMYYIYIY